MISAEHHRFGDQEMATAKPIGEQGLGATGAPGVRASLSDRRTRRSVEAWERNGTATGQGRTGRLKIRLGRKKAHTIYSVPESVAVRIHTRLLNSR